MSATDADPAHDDTQLTAEEFELLRALADTVLPAGDDGPGALDVGADAYAAKAFSTLPASARQRLRDGFELVQSLAEGQHERRFTELDLPTRDGILETVYKVPHRAPRLFLRLVIKLVLEGFLCHPRHGGNRDQLGWRFVGYEPREPSPQLTAVSKEAT